MRSRCIAYFVAHKRLLDHSEVLQGREKHVSIIGTSDVLDEASQLVAQSCEDFVFILHRLCVCVSSQVFCSRGIIAPKHTVEKGYQFLPRALWPQRQRNGRQPSNGIKAEKNIVMLCARVNDMYSTTRLRISYAPTFSSSMRTAMGYSSSLWFWSSMLGVYGGVGRG